MYILYYIEKGEQNVRQKSMESCCFNYSPLLHPHPLSDQHHPLLETVIKPLIIMYAKKRETEMRDGVRTVVEKVGAKQTLLPEGLDFPQ